MDDATQVAHSGARFSLLWSGDAEAGVPVALDVLLEANRDDAGLCTWLLAASIGDETTFGGGSAPSCTVRRIS